MHTVEVRFPSILRLRVPRELSDALDATASAKLMKKSEYVRRSLLQSLKDDGVIVPHPNQVST